MTRQIIKTVNKIADGVYIDEVDEMLIELVKAVLETGRSGRLSMTISVGKLAHESAISISGESKLVLPKKVPLSTIMFADEDGNVSTDMIKKNDEDIHLVANKESANG